MNKESYSAPVLTVLGTVAEHTLLTSCIVKAPRSTDNALGEGISPGRFVTVLPTC